MVLDRQKVWTDGRNGQTDRGAQWLSGRVLDSRPKGRGFEPHRHHCVVSLSKIINPSLVLVQPRKTRPFITERLLMGRKESNQTNKTDGRTTPKLYPSHETISLRLRRGIINMSCSRTQGSDAGEARTRCPSVSSQALYH